MRYHKLFLWVLGGVVFLFCVKVLAENYIEQRYTGRLIPITENIGIEVDDVDVRLLRGQLHLADVSIPDSLSDAASANLKSIDISGIQWLELIRNRKVKIKDVTLNGLSVVMDLAKVNPDSLKGPGPARILTADLPTLGLEFDADMNPRVTAIEANSLTYQPDSGNYNFEIRGIRSENPGLVITIDSFLMKPRYPKYEFGFRNGHRIGSVDMVIPEMNIHKLDLVRLTRDSVIDIQNIELVAPDVKIFTDKRVPVDMDRYVAMPHEMLLNSNLQIDIDSLNIESLYLKYETINPNTVNQGYVDFRYSYITIGNITNVRNSILENSVMSLDLYSKFMGVSDLNAHFQFHLDRDDYFFNWHGDLSRMEISEVDKFTVPVANMMIVSGDCESLKFNVEADMDSARGSLDFEYEDLKVMAIDPETNRHRRLLSGVANLFLLNENNRQEQSDYKDGIIRYAHETNRGLEHYVWTSLQVGLLYTILPEGIARRIDENTTNSLPDNGNHHKRKRRKRGN